MKVISYQDWNYNQNSFPKMSKILIYDLLFFIALYLHSILLLFHYCSLTSTNVSSTGSIFTFCFVLCHLLWHIFFQSFPFAWFFSPFTAFWKHLPSGREILKRFSVHQSFKFLFEHLYHHVLPLHYHDFFSPSKVSTDSIVSLAFSFSIPTSNNNHTPIFSVPLTVFFVWRLCSIKPTLKKVSKYENKFAKLQKKAAEFNFRNQLKTVKKKEFELEDDDKVKVSGLTGSLR